MTRRYKVAVLISIAVTCLALLLVAANRLCGDRVVATFQADSRRIVVWRSVGYFETDHLYYVISEGESREGPFFIGPVFRSSPNLELAKIGNDVFCIYNRDLPDDVYCYFDFANRLYYPSPDASQQTETINLQLIITYRGSSSLTNLINMK